MLDLLLTNLPKYDNMDPPAGVEMVHAMAKQAGFTSHTADFNLIFHRKITNKKLFQRMDNWLEITPSNKKIDLSLPRDDRKQLHKIYKIWLNIINQYEPKYLGFSIFSISSIKPALDFIPLIKKRFPSIKIIVGGCGTTPRNEELAKMVDYYVQGEGEIAIVEILNGNGKICPGVNGNPPKQIENLDSIPYPDYSDFNLSEYKFTKQLRVTASRGCIRRCNFCDVYKMWPMFRYRDGKSVANELFYQWSTLPTKPDFFVFTDNVLNGNMAMLRDMCNEIIRLKKENPEFRPKFLSHFIIPSPKFMTSDDWDLLEQAGCFKQLLGIESSSEKVRLTMNKKVKNEWITNYIQHAYDRSIRMTWCFIVGFPGETDEEYLESVKFCEKYKWMNNKDDFEIMIAINGFSISYENDWAIDHRDEIQYDTSIPNQDNRHWYYSKDGVSTLYEKRRARLIFFQKKIIEWGYQYKLLTQPHITMKELSESKLEQIIIDWYGIKSFGNYNLYSKYKKEIEKQYKAL